MINNNNNSTSNNNSGTHQQSPLKDNSNIQSSPHLTAQQGGSRVVKSGAQSPAAASTAPAQLSPQTPNSNSTVSTLRSIRPFPNVTNSTASSGPITSTTNSSSTTLKCLETLAQKAGITIDDKPDPPQQITLEKSQSPAQVAQPTSVPLQISPEQLQQLQQQYQFQQAFGNATIQVKQEYSPQAASQGGNGGQNMQLDLKQQMEQQQHLQMQVIEAGGGATPQSPHHQGNNALLQQQQQALNTMSTLQAMQGQQMDQWQGRVQVLQQPIQNAAPYLQQLYSPQQLVMSGNILQGLVQQQIQLIATKPYQGAP